MLNLRSSTKRTENSGNAQASEGLLIEGRSPKEQGVDALRAIHESFALGQTQRVEVSA